MQASKTAVVISNDVTYLTNLVTKFNGRPPDVQRRCFGGVVTWFQFVADERDDGRLVPKEATRTLEVWHVEQASCVVASARCLTIRVSEAAGRVGDEAEPVFAALFRFQLDENEIKNFRCELENAASTKRGSPRQQHQAEQEQQQQADEKKQLYRVVELITEYQTTACRIREVTGDAHLFIGDTCSAGDVRGDRHLTIELGID